MEYANMKVEDFQHQSDPIDINKFEGDEDIQRVIDIKTEKMEFDLERGDDRTEYDPNNPDFFDESNSRRRLLNTTLKQYAIYLSYLQSYPVLNCPFTKKSKLSDILKGLWKRLTDRLNSEPDGPHLPISGWVKRFRDWRNITKHKFRKLQEQKAIGDSTKITVYLTNLEEKALILWARATANSSLTKNFRISYNNHVDDDVLEANVETIIEQSPQQLPIVPPQKINTNHKSDSSKRIFSERLMSQDNVTTHVNNAKILKYSSSEDNFSDTGDISVKRKSIFKKRDPLKQKPVKLKKKTAGNNLNKLIKEELGDMKRRHNSFKKLVNECKKMYKRMEERKIELQKEELRFEIAKYKFLNNDFVFDSSDESE